jgi:hypothetical protein
MHASQNLPKAQALKDATMAWFIFKNLQIGETFLHFNGSYHSDNHESTVWYLNEYNKRTATPLNIITISTVEQENLSKLDEENQGKADFIICIPADMTKTIPSQGETLRMPATMPGKTMPAAPEKADTTKKSKPTDQQGDPGGDDDD